MSAVDSALLAIEQAQQALATAAAALTGAPISDPSVHDDLPPDLRELIGPGARLNEDGSVHWPWLEDAHAALNRQMPLTVQWDPSGRSYRPTPHPVGGIFWHAVEPWLTAEQVVRSTEAINQAFGPAIMGNTYIDPLTGVETRSWSCVTLASGQGALARGVWGHWTAVRRSLSRQLGREV